MELQQYIAETLKHIINGVKEAQKYANEADAKVNPAHMFLSENGRVQINKGGVVPDNVLTGQMIEFDIVVTITEGDQIKAGAGIFAGPVGLGSQGQTETMNSAVNRIKFSIPVFLPVQKK